MKTWGSTILDEKRQVTKHRGCTGISHFSAKVRFTAIGFYERSILVPFFANQRKSKKNFCFNNSNNKKAKSENSIQHSFCNEPLRRQRAPWGARVAPQAPSQGNSVASQRWATRALTCVCEYPLYLNLFCAFTKKMCPKVIAFSLYAILAYKIFHRNALLSDSGENLYNGF